MQFDDDFDLASDYNLVVINTIKGLFAANYKTNILNRQFAIF